MWGDNISAVEGIQCSGGITSVLWGDNISAVEVVQYCGDTDFKNYEFLDNPEFCRQKIFVSHSDRRIFC